MKVRVYYTTQLKAALGIGSEEVQVEQPGTLSTLIHELGQRHGDAFRQLVLDERGRVLPSILLCVGDQQLESHRDVELKEGEAVTILSPISGG
jgi:molybdopterin converting factor small subunit